MRGNYSSSCVGATVSCQLEIILIQVGYNYDSTIQISYILIADGLVCNRNASSCIHESDIHGADSKRQCCAR